MKIILKILVTSLAAYLAALLLPGIYIQGYLSAIILAVILGLLNIFLKPLLVLLTLPLTIFTFGLFLLVINALIILLASQWTHGFEVDGFWWALLYSIVLSIFSSLLTNLANRNQKA